MSRESVATLLDPRYKGCLFWSEQLQVITAWAVDEAMNTAVNVTAVLLLANKARLVTDRDSHLRQHLRPNSPTQQ